MAFTAALILAATIIRLQGADEHGINAALAATARLSFLLFLPAYASGALAGLFGAMFLPLKRQSRAFGLSFASAQLVHLGLVGWLCLIGAAPELRTFLVFGAATFWLYLIAFFSIGKWQSSLNPALQMLLFRVGMNYIAYAFAIDFLKSPLTGGTRHIAEYLPFAILAVAGPVLQLAVFWKRLLLGLKARQLKKLPAPS